MTKPRMVTRNDRLSGILLSLMYPGRRHMLANVRAVSYDNVAIASHVSRSLFVSNCLTSQCRDCLEIRAASRLWSSHTRRGTMLSRIVPSLDAAVHDIADDSIVLIGGFGEVGVPYQLIGALARQGRANLTVVNNNAGNRNEGVAELLLAGSVGKVIC